MPAFCAASRIAPRPAEDVAPVLATRNLTVPGKFRNVSIDVRPGEVVGLFGDGGADQLLQPQRGLDRMRRCGHGEVGAGDRLRTRADDQHGQASRFRRRT